jgi:hypothetical protein
VHQGDLERVGDGLQIVKPILDQDTARNTRSTKGLTHDVYAQRKADVWQRASPADGGPRVSIGTPFLARGPHRHPPAELVQHQE